MTKQRFIRFGARTCQPKEWAVYCDPKGNIRAVKAYDGVNEESRLTNRDIAEKIASQLSRNETVAEWIMATGVTSREAIRVAAYRQQLPKQWGRVIESNGSFRAQPLPH